MNTTFSWIVTIIIFIVVNVILFKLLIKVEVNPPVAKYYYRVELTSGTHYESQEYDSLWDAVYSIEYNELYGSFDLVTLTVGKCN